MNLGRTLFPCLARIGKGLPSPGKQITYANFIDHIHLCNLFENLLDNSIM